ncbi:MAG: ExbD/TolR family protein [Chitinophagales bacterium]
MTELNISELSHKKACVLPMKKAALKIDMTPMVDLGFLLISFFIFTTEISKPATTNLYMPHAGKTIDIADSKSITILLANNDRVFYYYGNLDDAMRSKKIFQTSYDEMNGLGSIIRQKQAELEKRNIDKKELVVLIEPGKECSYKNVVNTLDEMLINKVTKYVIIDPGKKEETLLKGDF